jgi:GNAT superfamily N-acetyltransferase
MIRAARGDELPLLQTLEQAAGAPFRELAMYSIADDASPSLEDLAAFQQNGRAWVVADVDDRPVAYLLVDVVDGSAYVEQVSVHPDHARKCLGALLLDHAAAWAQQHGLAALTLTMFTDVPWNGPYYQRLGFRHLSDTELTPGLQAVRAREAERGLDAWPRTTMRRDITSELSAPRSRRQRGGSCR